MEGQNILADTIDEATAISDCDRACKKVASNKMLLAWLLKKCEWVYRDSRIEDIAYRYIEGNSELSEADIDVKQVPEFIIGDNTESISLSENRINFDIIFRTLLPEMKEVKDMIVNIEIQKDYYPGYPLIKRGIYYACRLVSTQYGTVFNKEQYQKLRKVSCIWICLKPPKNRRNTITAFTINKTDVVGTVLEEFSNYDIISIVMINLGGLSNGAKDGVFDEADERYKGVIKLMNVVFSPDIEKEEKKRVMNEEFGIPITEELERSVDDMWDIHEYWYEEGEEKGREEGREEGCDETLEAFDLIAKGVNTIKGLIENGISQQVAEKVIARS